MASEDLSGSIFNDDYEQTLCVINTVFVFRIPPRSSSEGYKAENWGEPLWTGKCKVIAIGERCEVRLEDPKTGKNFATCIVNTDEKGPQAIERVLDSTRYFVLRIEDKQKGRHAFIGIGFSERSEAFDFNVALQDHQKLVKRLHEQQENPQVEEQKDYSLQEGEKIKVNIKVKTKGRTTQTSGNTKSGNDDNSGLNDISSFLGTPPSSSRAKSGNSNTPNNNNNNFLF
ncbi:hypothetical protein ABK040_000295 [Willaertia magna]